MMSLAKFHKLLEPNSIKRPYTAIICTIVLVLALILPYQHIYSQAEAGSAEMNLTVTAGDAPDGSSWTIHRGDFVTYRYLLSNTGGVSLGEITLVDSPHGDVIANGTLVSGDVNQNLILDAQEDWVYELVVETLYSDIKNLGLAAAREVGPTGEIIAHTDVASASDFASVKVIPLAEISGYVYEDTDADGLGDAGIPGVVINLQDHRDVHLTTLTDKDGHYRFQDIVSGSFHIRQTQPDGYSSASDTDGQNDNVIAGTVLPDAISENNNFIEAKQKQILNGQVYKDTSGDQLGDTPLVGSKVSVIDGNGDMTSTLTGENGNYSFYVSVGNYTITQYDKVNYSSISDASGDNDNIISGTIQTAQTINNLDFVDTQDAMITGKVEMDLDNDGKADRPMGSVMIRLQDGQGALQSTMTNAFGNYAFSMVPGEFMVLQEDAEGYRSVSDRVGANDNMITGSALPGAIIEDQNFLDALVLAACVSLRKSSTIDAGADGNINTGDVINYVFEVTNCGDTDLDNIVISEIAAGFSGTNPLPVIGAIIPSILSPGQTGTGTAVYPLSQFDIDSGQVLNQAEVTALDDLGESVLDISDSGNAADEAGTDQDITRTIIEAEGCIELIKTASLDLGADGVANPGDEISYVYELTNCGELTLSNVNIMETAATFSGTNPVPVLSNPIAASLAPGMTGSGTAIYSLSQFDIDAGMVTNQAMASAATLGGTTIVDVSDSGNAADEMGTTEDLTRTFIPVDACIELTKSSTLNLGPDGFSNPGDELTYEFTYTNCGNVTLDNISISEIESAFTGSGSLPIPSGLNPLQLAPGQTGSGTAVYNISQFDIDQGIISNQAMISATAPDGSPVTDLSDSANAADDRGTDEDVTETTIPARPCISLVKAATVLTGPDLTITVGDLVRYEYTVTNCGLEPLSSMIISETAAQFTGTGTLPTPSAVIPATLEPGDSGVAEAYYALTQTDIDSGLITNQASVSASTEDGLAVVDLSDSNDPVDNTGGEDDPTTTPLINCSSLACNSGLQLSLSLSCELVLRPDMLLKNSLERANYTIELFDQEDNFLRNDTIFSSDAGADLIYKISCGPNSCWGTINVENNIIPQLSSPCACGDDQVIPEECTVWCGAAEPSIIVSATEAMEQLQECGPQMTGELSVREVRVGDLCDPNGEIVEINYSAKFIIHGEIETVDLLCQRYRVEKLDIDLSADEFELGFGFPRNVILDCNYLTAVNSIDGNDFAYATPASIFAATGSGSLAYTYFIDKHQNIDQVRIDTTVRRVLAGTVERDTLVRQDLDMDGDLEWVLITVVDKVLKDSIVYDTTVVGQIHPEVPIIERTCNLLASYSDLEFDACGSGKKIVREWILVDWCDARIQKNGSQTIYIKDQTAPIIIDEAGDQISELSDLIAKVDPWTCQASVKLPELQYIDDCSEDMTIEWHTEGFSIQDGYVVGLSIADEMLKMTAVITDDCNNSTALQFNLVVIDDSPPAAVCKSALIVVLSTQDEGGFAKVSAEDLDAGSHDSGCGEVTIRAVREDDWIVGLYDCEGVYLGYEPTSCEAITQTVTRAGTKDCPATDYEITEAGDYVKFCCADADKEIHVLLFLTDKSGNTNVCRVPVRVENKTAPTLICEDAVVDCDNDTDALMPTIIGGMCGGASYTASLLHELSEENKCRDGQIIREWYIDLDGSDDFNQGDAYCRQVLTLSDEALFDPYSIRWPVSMDGSIVDGYSLACGPDSLQSKVIQLPEPVACMPQDDQHMPRWCENDCQIIGYSQEIDTVVSLSSCLSIIRRWTVIDWCTYESNGEDRSESDVVIAVHDHRDRSCIKCEPEQNTVDSLYYQYRTVEEDGYYTYDQLIKIVDDTAPVISMPDTIVVTINTPRTAKDDPAECMGETMIRANAKDFCGINESDPSRLQWTVLITKEFQVMETARMTGDSISISSMYGEAGDVHEVLWAVRDGCGNQSSGITLVYFVDERAPTPLCITGLSTSVSEDGDVAEVWAADFDFGSYDNCSDDLDFTIVREDVTPLRPSDEGYEEQRAISIPCSELENFQSLDVWVWDAAGNADRCAVALTIDPDEAPCMDIDTTAGEGALHLIAGSIMTNSGKLISGAKVEVSTSLSEYPKQDSTESEGTYLFNQNPGELNYTVTAAKDGDDLNGVSAIDLVFISRHIVDIQAFDDPLKILAADVNADGRVSAQDIVELKRLILNVNDGFTKADSWLMIDADQTFVDPQSPWPFVTDIQILDLNRNMMEEDFVAIKLGDINDSAHPNSIEHTESRSSDAVELRYDDQIVRQGEIVRVAVHNPSLSEVFGFQLALFHEGLELLSVSSEIIQISQDDYNSSDQKTNLLWYSDQALSFEQNEAIFNLTFKAMEDLRLSDVLQINRDRISSELYHGQGFNTSHIELVSAEISHTLRVGQNEPNPFSAYTDIPFQISSSGKVILQVFDASGKLLLNRNENLLAGSHRFTLRDQDVASKGILYYRIEFNGESQTMKMVVIK